MLLLCFLEFFFFGVHFFVFFSGGGDCDAVGAVGVVVFVFLGGEIEFMGVFFGGFHCGLNVSVEVFDSSVSGEV